MKISIYLPVIFPVSQYFLEEKFKDKIHLINDEIGIKQWGNSAYFVPVDLFIEVALKNREDFQGIIPFNLPINDKSEIKNGSLRMRIMESH